MQKKVEDFFDFQQAFIRKQKHTEFSEEGLKFLYEYLTWLEEAKDGTIMGEEDKTLIDVDYLCGRYKEYSSFELARKCLGITDYWHAAFVSNSGEKGNPVLVDLKLLSESTNS